MSGHGRWHIRKTGLMGIRATGLLQAFAWHHLWLPVHFRHYLKPCSSTRLESGFRPPSHSFVQYHDIWATVYGNGKRRTNETKPKQHTIRLLRNTMQQLTTEHIPLRHHPPGTEEPGFFRQMQAGKRCFSISCSYLLLRPL